TICQGASFTVGNSTYTESGEYQDVLQTINGCDSVINLLLTVNPTFNETQTEVICEGENVIVGSSSYTETGTYTDSLQTVNGCDSVITLDLTVNPVFDTLLTQTICQGESATISGGEIFYNETGVYTETLRSISGCDSIIRLDLTVQPVFSITEEQTICQGDSVVIGTSVYTTSGRYIDTLQTINGCDSIVTLSLNVNQSFEFTFSEVICDDGSVTLGDNVFTEAGTYTDSLTSITGCDSIIMLTIVVNPTFEEQLNQTICQGESFFVGDNEFNESGSYTVTLNTINGCDSIINLELSVLTAIQTNLDEVICEGEVVEMGGQEFSQPGLYIDTLQAVGGCDSVISLQLEVLGASFQTAMANGDQSTCDETVSISAVEIDNPLVSGEWMTLGNQFITDPFSASTNVSDLEKGENIFIWSLSAEACGAFAFSTDTVRINFDLSPIANDDEFTLLRETPIRNRSIIENDSLPDNYTIQFNNIPEEIVIEENEGLIDIIPQSDFIGDLSFTYLLCNETCEECSEATVNVSIVKNANLQRPTFYLCTTCANSKPFEPVPCLPDCYQNPENSIVIVNRWGDVVFEEAPFSGQWFGNSTGGQPLPAGTYYYILRLDLGNQEILVGEIIILR
ncbi:MAG: gliding motility-associated C-terminal domain-containing protein, partial [Bacteroidota bacterium]